MSKIFLFQTIQFSQTVLIQTIQFSISIIFAHTQLNIKTVLFQTIQFSISMQFSSIKPIDKTLSGTTTLGLSGPGSNGNEGVLYIYPKYQYYWNLTIRLFSVISRTLVGGILPLCRDAVGVFYSPHRQVNLKIEDIEKFLEEFNNSKLELLFMTEYAN